MLSNQQKLEKAVSFVKRLKKDLDTLYQNNKKLFEGRKELHDAFMDVFTKIDRSQQRLEHPVLSIATVGTTSAGKSTIVNALIGRRIAPMHEKEMSAGVLQLLPDKQVSMTVKKSSHWESGKFPDIITDEQAYDKIQSIFETYKKFEKITTAPNITVRGPLLWDTHPELLGLPNNISVEFIDLPGLNSASDPNNIKIIQDNLSRSLCIVAINCLDVNDKTLERLLEELQDIIKAMSGSEDNKERKNTDSILFLYNKFDALDLHIESLESRISYFKQLVCKRLNLKEKQVNIIPFASRLLYYAQSSIGNNFYTDKQELNCNEEFLDGLFANCEYAFGRKSPHKKLGDDVYGFLDNKTKIPDDILKKFISVCYKLSGANEILAELKRRIQESFAAVIIQPAINDTEKAVEFLLSKLHTYIAINKSNNELELLTEQLGLAKKKFILLGSASDEHFNDLKKDIANVSSNLSKLNVGAEDDSIKVKKLLTSRIEELKKAIEEKQLGKIDERLDKLEVNTTEIGDKLVEILQQSKNVQTEINNYLSQQNGKNPAFVVFAGLIDVPKLVKDKLNLQIIAIFRANLINNKGKGALEEELRKNLPAVWVTPLLGHYETIRDTFAKWTANGYTQDESHFVYKTKTQISSDNLTATQTMYDNLNRRMRDVLSKKTNILFQLEANTFATLLHEFIHSEINAIIALMQENLGKTGIDLSKQIHATLAIKEQEIKLPEKLFEFTAPSYNLSTEKDCEYVEDGSHTEGSCCNRKTVIDYKKVEWNVYQYDFPNANGIYEAWRSGIYTSEIQFWEIITDWVNKTVEDYLSDIKTVSTEIITETNNMIVARLAEKKEDVINNEKIFDAISEIVNNINNNKIEFKKAIL